MSKKKKNSKKDILQNLQKSVKWFKDRWLFIILILISLTLISLRLSQKKSSSTSEITSSRPLNPSPINQPQIDGFSLPPTSRLDLTEADFPSELPVYFGQIENFSIEQANSIAHTLGFSQTTLISNDVFLGSLLFWENNNHYLKIATEAGRINYGLISPTTVPQNISFPSSGKAREALSDFLTKLDIVPVYQTAWQQEKYLIGANYLYPTDQVNEANLIMIGFNPTLKNFQLVSSDPQTPLISLILDRRQNITRFDFQANYSNFRKGETYPLKNYQEMMISFKREAKIVMTSDQKTTLEPNISQISFTQARLAYFQEHQPNPIIQPIFILSGTGKNEADKSVEVIACLPAISSKWLKTINSPSIPEPSSSFQLPFLKP